MNPNASNDGSLRELHRRMAELETALAAPAREKPSIQPWLPLIASILIAFVVGGVSARACIGPRDVVTVPSLRDPPMIPPGALVLAGGAGPSLVDVDGDGAKDLVVRAWRAGQDEAPLHVVCFDRKTFAVRWRAGPWPAERWSRGQLLVVGQRVVVTDASAAAHVLDAGTGAELRRVGLPRPAGNILAIPDDPNRVLIHLVVDDRLREMEGPTIVLDLQQAQWSTRSAERRVHSCASDGSSACMESHKPDRDPRLLALYAPLYGALEVRDGVDHFTLAQALVAPGPGFSSHAVVWDEDTGKVKWRGPLVPASRRWGPYPNTVPDGFTELSSRRILHVYPLMTGSYRITARDLGTGAKLYDVDLPGLDYGMSISSFTAESDTAFIVANGSLFVVDATTGAVTRRIDAF